MLLKVTGFIRVEELGGNCDSAGGISKPLLAALVVDLRRLCHAKHGIITAYIAVLAAWGSSGRYWDQLAGIETSIQFRRIDFQAMWVFCILNEFMESGNTSDSAHG